MANKNIDVKLSPSFTEASTRENISSGENIKTILGKIKKFFTDLKPVAFSGDYNDLRNTPINSGSISKSFALSNSNGVSKITITFKTGLTTYDYGIFCVCYKSIDSFTALNPCLNVIGNETRSKQGSLIVTKGSTEVKMSLTSSISNNVLNIGTSNCSILAFTVSDVSIVSSIVSGSTTLYP